MQVRQCDSCAVEFAMWEFWNGSCVGVVAREKERDKYIVGTTNRNIREGWNGEIVGETEEGVRTEKYWVKETRGSEWRDSG